MSTALDDILNNINLAGALRGCFISDNEGKIVAKQMIDTALQNAPEAIAARIMSLVATAESSAVTDGRLVGSDWDFTDGKALYRGYDWGAVIMIGGPKANTSLLNLLLNVALPKIGRIMDTDDYRARKRKPLSAW